MARCLSLLVGKGEIGGRRIVDEKALRETWTPQVVIRSSGSELRAYGLGWLEVQVKGETVGASFHDVNLAIEHLHHDVFMLSSPYLGDLSAAFTVSEDEVLSLSVPLGSRWARRLEMAVQYGSRRWQPTRDDRTSIRSRLQADLAAVGLHDFSTQGKAEAGAGLFRRIKRQERLFHRFFIHTWAVV